MVVILNEVGSRIYKDKYEIIICNTGSKNKVIEYNEILFEGKMNNEI